MAKSKKKDIGVIVLVIVLAIVFTVAPIAVIVWGLVGMANDWEREDQGDRWCYIYDGSEYTFANSYPDLILTDTNVYSHDGWIVPESAPTEKVKIYEGWVNEEDQSPNKKAKKFSAPYDMFLLHSSGVPGESPSLLLKEDYEFPDWREDAEIEYLLLSPVCHAEDKQHIGTMIKNGTKITDKDDIQTFLDLFCGIVDGKETTKSDYTPNWNDDDQYTAIFIKYKDFDIMKYEAVIELDDYGNLAYWEDAVTTLPIGKNMIELLQKYS